MSKIIDNPHPMPGDVLSGSTVVASVFYRDEPDEPMSYTVLMLNETAPYYSVQIIEDAGYGSWRVTDKWTAENIVPAVDLYRQAGGDY